MALNAIILVRRFCQLSLFSILLIAATASSLLIPKQAPTRGIRRLDISPVRRDYNTRNDINAEVRKLYPLCIGLSGGMLSVLGAADALSTPSFPVPNSSPPAVVVDSSPFLGGVLANDVLFAGWEGVLFSYLLVSFSDCIPFLPCQPLAVALGAKLGFAAAFPITVLGQTTAGVLAFTAARRAADSELVREAAEGLSPEATEKFEEFRRIGGVESAVDEGDGEESRGDQERKVLLALIGLRLAPFFPFSAGNYLLGGATSVPFRLFVLATLLGSTLSNFVSTSIGAGGAEWLPHFYYSLKEDTLNW